MGEPAKTVVTLVHGTFARGTAWTRPDSKLCRYLTGELPGPVAIKSFEWSGHNNHDSRQEAARTLRAQLVSQVAEVPDATHYVVAHSHGGNVALYALADTALDGRIAAVFCLNTPFISVLKRNISHYRNLVRLLLSLLAVAAVFWGLALVALMADEVYKDLIKGEDQPVWYLGLVALIAGILLLLPLLLLWRLLRGLASLSHERAQAHRDRLLAELKLPDLRATRVVCVNNAGDEIDILFSILGAITHLPYVMCHYLVLRTFTWLAVILGVVFSALAFIGYVTNPTRVPGLEILARLPQGPIRDAIEVVFGIGLIVTFLLLAIIAYAVFFLFIAAVVNRLISHLPLGVSGRKTSDTFLIRMETTPVPVASCATEFYDLDRGASLLSHLTAYEDDETLGIITRRMRELMA